jgi:hypothetical protein
VAVRGARAGTIYIHRRIISCGGDNSATWSSGLSSPAKTITQDSQAVCACARRASSLRGFFSGAKKSDQSSTAGCRRAAREVWHAGQSNLASSVVAGMSSVVAGILPSAWSFRLSHSTSSSGLVQTTPPLSSMMDGLKKVGVSLNRQARRMAVSLFGCSSHCTQSTREGQSGCDHMGWSA